ncbi:hypothetical protein CEY00_Acc33747, partial [Actinidia chinensis var. chinensis]
MTMAMCRPAAIFTISPLKLKRSARFAKMALNVNHGGGKNRKLPVLLFDVMDTIVRDPFYEDVPAFFSMSLKELIECKHPTAWIEFERGLIDEMEFARNF